MIFVFYALAALLIWFSAKSFVGGIKYLRYFKQELSNPRPAFTPFVSVIVPCRGIDDGLKENLDSIIEQDYPAFEVIFVVDDPDDASVATIQEASRKVAKAAKRAALVVAQKSVESGQKVENLRAAVVQISDRSQVIAFADSDARMPKGWLLHLVAPLADESVGLATGYRWYISKKPTFASEMRSVWNASIASALGPRSEFCWGGATAIRRETFDRLNIRESWRGTVSDDFLMARVMKEAGLTIIFVPQALTPSIENCTFRELLEFTTRQMKLTRVYAPRLWLMSLIGSALFNVVVITAFLIAILSRANTAAVCISLAILAIVAIFSIGKAWLRLNAVKLVLTGYAPQLGRQTWTQNTLWLLSPALFLYNSTAALLSRRMTWRGITYELKSPNETVIISD